MSRSSLYEYCLVSNKQALISQWDTESNGDLTIYNVTKASHKYVWWKCERGHKWQAPVYSRTNQNSGCPYCANKKLAPGTHTLQEEYPDIARQWHPILNEQLTPDDVSPNSHRTVWWKCDRGHEWKAQIKSRTHGSGCPYCTNRKIKIGENDLATTHPKLAEQWNDECNGNMSPVSVSAGSAQKVWWKCDKGHEWQASIMSRSQGAGCLVCAGKKVIAGDNDLATAFPDIAAEWHPTLNGTLTPKNVTPFSNRSVWWICELGHEYQAAVGHRTQTRSGCPYCAGRKVLPGFNDLAIKEPVLCNEWAQVLNGALTPQMVTVASHKKVWWRCSEGHAWKAVIASRTGARRHGCPECAGKVKRKYT